MKLILVITLVVIGLARAKADVPEFSEDILEEVFDIPTLDAFSSDAISSDAINLDATVGLQKVESSKTGIILSPEKSTSSKTKHEICHRDFGIATGEDKAKRVYCKIAVFGLYVENVPEYPDIQKVTFTQIYLPSKGKTGLLLQIPVLKLPSELASLPNPEDLKIWAHGKKVVILQASDIEGLKNVACKEGLWWTGFKWIDDLLKFGLRFEINSAEANEIMSPVKVAITRPLLLEEEALKLLVDNIDKLRKKENSDDDGSDPVEE